MTRVTRHLRRQSRSTLGFAATLRRLAGRKRQLHALPAARGTTMAALLKDRGANSGVELPGKAQPNNGGGFGVGTPRYFETLGLPVTLGRAYLFGMKALDPLVFTSTAVSLLLAGLWARTTCGERKPLLAMLRYVR